jgi:hypothetical protein
MNHVPDFAGKLRDAKLHGASFSLFHRKEPRLLNKAGLKSWTRAFCGTRDEQI